MRRSRLVQLVGGAIMVASLLMPSAALASSGPPSAAGIRQGTATPVAVSLPAIKLGCALVVKNPLGPDAPRRAIVCRWTAPDGVAVRAYRLRRVVDAPHAARLRLIATVPASDPLRYADGRIARGHKYTYLVVALGADGSRVAVSNRVTVRVGRPAESLRLGCAIATTGDQRGVACRWSRTSRPAAVGYVLLRSVDGGPRERIYRTGLPGPRVFVDLDVKAGQQVRYAVLAVAKSGRVVGLGGPVLVRIPGGSATAR